MRKVIAAAFSDLHAHKWKQYNQNNRRLSLGAESLKIISEACMEHNCPALFAGDLYHADKEVPQEVTTAILTAYKEHFENNKISFYAISGNHDQSQRNNFDSRSPSHLDGYNAVFSTFQQIDYSYSTWGNYVVFGIPYNNGNVDIKKFLKRFRKVNSKGKKKILLIHSDLPNCKDVTGIVLDSYENISRDYKKFFAGFDLVLSGHIHQHQQLSSKVWMLGAMYQQRTSDMNTEMGYCLIYDDMSVEFVPVPFPEFKYSDEDDGFNFCLPKPKKKIVVEGKKVKSYKNTSDPMKLGTRYLKDKEITDKAKIKALTISLKR